MTREWAPGDVALCPAHGERMLRSTEGRWWHPGYDCPQQITDRRINPLLVLDPESDDDAHRVIRAFWDHHNDDCDDVRAMRDALRSLVAPPGPEEPLTLGAVVTVNHPVYEWARAVRIAERPPSRLAWYYTDSSGNGGTRSWEALVKIGVTP